MTQYKPGDHVHVTIPGKAEWDDVIYSKYDTCHWRLYGGFVDTVIIVHEKHLTFIAPTYPPCPCGKQALLSGKSGLVECECGNRLDPDTWARVFDPVKKTCRWEHETDAQPSFFHNPHSNKWEREHPGRICNHCGLPVEIVS